MNNLAEPFETTLYNLPQLPMLEIAGYLTPWGRVAWRVCSKQMKSILNPKAEVFLFNSLKLGIRSYVGDFSVERVQAFADWLGTEKEAICIRQLIGHTNRFGFPQLIEHPNGLGTCQFFIKTMELFPNIQSIHIVHENSIPFRPPSQSKLSISLELISLTNLPTNLYHQIDSLTLDYQGREDVVPFCEKGLTRMTHLGLTNLGCETIPRLPENLKSLVIYSETLKSIGGIPSGLKNAKLDLPVYRHRLPLPPSVLKLELTQTSQEQLKVLESLDQLYELVVKSSSINRLEGIPDSLTKLELRDLSALTELGLLPPHLKELDCARCGIGSIARFPENLEMLFLSDLPATSLPELPDNLIEFTGSNLTSCAFPQPATRITSFEWKGSAPIGTIALPESLQFLSLEFVQFYDHVVELPLGLKDLKWRKNVAYAAFPETLLSLRVDNVEVTSLPNLPLSLVELELNDLDSLTTLPHLPDSLERLDVFGCKQLRHNPNIPRNISHVRGYTGAIYNIINEKKMKRAITKNGTVRNLDSHIR